MKSLAGEDVTQISLSKAMKRCTRRPSVQQIPPSNANALYMSGGFFKIIKAGQQVSRRLHRAGVDVLYETSASLLAEPAPFFPPSFDQHLASIAKSAAPGNCLVCLYGCSSSKCYSGLGEKKVEIYFRVGRRQKSATGFRARPVPQRHIPHIHLAAVHCCSSRMISQSTTKRQRRLKNKKKWNSHIFNINGIHATAHSYASCYSYSSTPMVGLDLPINLMCKPEQLERSCARMTRKPYTQKVPSAGIEPTAL